MPRASFPDDAMRAHLKERAGHIKHWMKPAPAGEIVKQVAALTHFMKLRNWDQNTSKAILQTYALDLADQPLFAIQEACTAFRRMEVGDGWMPGPGDLLVETKARGGWLRKESIDIDRILNAEVEEEREMARGDCVKAIVNSLKKDMAMARPKNEIARGYREANTETALSPEEVLAKTVEHYQAEPVSISPHALAAHRKAMAA